jgi:nucleotide-binding universal stress UspA family protein
MIKLRRVLVPVDFSEFGKHALKYGCEFARRFGAELHVVHVVEDIYPMVPEAGMLLPAQGDYLAELQNSARKALEHVPQADWCTGIGDVVRSVETGAPFLEVIRYAREKEIDLIVIGTHGRSGLVHMLMGSVAEKIVRKAPCPVLTVRPEGHDFVMP